MTTSVFKKCSTCKAPIFVGAKYYRCSVSTCNRKATALYFCSVPCWDAHVPDARHRDAWAEEEIASAEQQDVPMIEKAQRRIVSGRAEVRMDSEAASELTGPSDDPNLPKDILVVVSKLKAYVKAKSEMRTSDGVSDPLSDHLRSICDRAIASARTNQRGTVLARDIEAALRGTTASE